jgi:hypothetical protein
LCGGGCPSCGEGCPFVAVVDPRAEEAVPLWRGLALLDPRNGRKVRQVPRTKGVRCGVGQTFPVALFEQREASPRVEEAVPLWRGLALLDPRNGRKVYGGCPRTKGVRCGVGQVSPVAVFGRRMGVRGICPHWKEAVPPWWGCSSVTGGCPSCEGAVPRVEGLSLVWRRLSPCGGGWPSRGGGCPPTADHGHFRASLGKR